MKKITVLLLALMLLFSLDARAESPVYDLLARLMGGREFILTVEAEGDGELAGVIGRYGKVTCTLRQEDGRIVLNASCDGEAGAYLNAYATAEGAGFDTNLIENGSFQTGWAQLAPEVSAGAEEINVRMTGPDHELITFTCKVSGGRLTDCAVEIHVGYITGPGNVHSLWDGVTIREGEASREFYFTFSEEEYAVEGEGSADVRTEEDGTTYITRDEECLITYQDDELGTVTFHSVLVFR